MINKLEGFDSENNTFVSDSEITSVPLTRRNVFFVGLCGKIKCIYHWYLFQKEKRKIGFYEWLDEPLAYRLESIKEKETPKNQNNKQYEEMLKCYLLEESARERINSNSR